MKKMSNPKEKKIEEWKKELEEVFTDEKDKRKLWGATSAMRGFIYQLLQSEKQKWQEKEKEAYKEGYNQCLKDQKLTGERYQNLYL